MYECYLGARIKGDWYGTVWHRYSYGGCLDIRGNHRVDYHHIHRERFPRRNEEEVTKETISLRHVKFTYRNADCAPFWGRFVYYGRCAKK